MKKRKKKPEKSFERIVEKTFLTPKKRKRHVSPNSSAKSKKRKFEQVFELQSKIVNLETSLDQKDKEILRLSLSRTGNDSSMVRPPPQRPSFPKREEQSRIQFSPPIDSSKLKKYENVIRKLVNENKTAQKKISTLYNNIKTLEKKSISLETQLLKEKTIGETLKKKIFSLPSTTPKKKKSFAEIDPEKEEYRRLAEKYITRTQMLERELEKFKSPSSMNRFVGTYPPSTIKSKKRISKTDLFPRPQSIPIHHTPSRVLPFQNLSPATTKKKNLSPPPQPRIRFLEEEFDLQPIEITSTSSSSEDNISGIEADLELVSRIMNKKTPSPPPSDFIQRNIPQGIVPPPPLQTSSSQRRRKEEQQHHHNHQHFVENEEAEPESDYRKLLRELQTTMKEEIERLQDKNKDLQNKLRRNITSEDDKKYLVTLKEENVHHHNTIKSLKEIIKNKTSQHLRKIESMTSELKEWRGRFSNVGESPEKVSSYLLKLQKKNQNLEIQSSKSTHNTKLLILEIEGLKKDVEKKNEVISKIKEKKLLAENEIPDMELKMASAEMSAMRAKENQEIAERELKRVCGENTTLKKTVEDWKNRVNELNGEIQKIRKALDEPGRVLRPIFRPPPSNPDQVEQRVREDEENMKKMNKRNNETTEKINVLEKKVKVLEKSKIELRKFHDKSMARIKGVFREKLGMFRRFLYALSGFQLDQVAGDGTIYKVSSLYMREKDDHLLFRFDKEKFQIDLLETEFVKREGLISSEGGDGKKNNLPVDPEFQDCIKYLKELRCYPSFLASLQLALYQKSTVFFEYVNKK